MNMKKPVIKTPTMPAYAKPLINTPKEKLVKKSGCGCGKRKVR
ncbi:MAG: hypothetical protein ACO1OT_15765 [Heyndrickxia sp.]